MKTVYFVSVLSLFLISSCVSIRVTTDFDKEANFSSYTTYGFYKKGIDEVKVSDLDKKRILRSIEKVMKSKGFSASEEPDILINFFTDSRKDVSIDPSPYGYYGFGYGWGPLHMSYYHNRVSSSTQGILYIDLIDASTKSLVWQGKGIGSLTSGTGDRDTRIQEFVNEILETYPARGIASD